jgi:hypothetical protein
MFDAATRNEGKERQRRGEGRCNMYSLTNQNRLLA